MILKILAGLLLACLLTIGIQTWRVSHCKAKLAALQGVANTLHDANQTNMATIAKLQAANKQWAETNAANLANAKIYTDAAMEYAKKQQALADAATAKLRAIYDRQPDAKAWAATPLPADVAGVLREQASDTH